MAVAQIDQARIVEALEAGERDRARRRRRPQHAENAAVDEAVGARAEIGAGIGKIGAAVDELVVPGAVEADAGLR